ncbi:MGMT family protein [Synechococcus sp. PCC 7336]|uniref:MGMT family protein n=1 Tax=Synechococcus sp. PCC 7336 TaxID=195250 RepID=UPI001D0D0439|nr:MGMT family protein [Synechococcus sp. PCC 7336]
MISTPRDSKPLYEQFYETVRQIPPGKVATYGQVARWSGYPGYARQVGYALFRLDRETDVPWQRVINAKGEISQSPMRYGSDDLQREILLEEGVQFSDRGKIDLAQFGWEPPSSK